MKIRVNPQKHLLKDTSKILDYEGSVTQILSIAVSLGAITKLQFFQLNP